MSDQIEEVENVSTTQSPTALDVVAKAGPTTSIGIGVLALVWTLQQNVQTNTGSLDRLTSSSVEISTKLDRVEDDISELKLELTNRTREHDRELREIDNRVREIEMRIAGHDKDN